MEGVGKGWGWGVGVEGLTRWRGKMALRVMVFLPCFVSEFFYSDVNETRFAEVYTHAV